MSVGQNRMGLLPWLSKVTYVWGVLNVFPNVVAGYSNYTSASLGVGNVRE